MNKNTQEAIYDVRELSKGKVAVLGLQHMFAMFGATVLVPLLTGLDVSTTLLFAGLGTLLFHVLTKMKVPAFLGSSFAFLGSMGAAFAGGVSAAAGYLGLICGAAFAGLVYVVIAIIVKFVGVGEGIDDLQPFNPKAFAEGLFEALPEDYEEDEYDESSESYDEEFNDTEDYDSNETTIVEPSKESLDTINFDNF